MAEDKEKNLYKALRLACEGERIGVLVEENGGNFTIYPLKRRTQYEWHKLVKLYKENDTCRFVTLEDSADPDFGFEEIKAVSRYTKSFEVIRRYAKQTHAARFFFKIFFERRFYSPLFSTHPP